MKKFLAVLIMLFSSIGLLISCSSKNPNCSLEVTSVGNSISYTLSFEDLRDTQTSYKVELFKGETSIKHELVSIEVSAGSFKDLEFNTEYKISVFVSDKGDYDLLLSSKAIQTELGTFTGVSFKDKTFTYDGTPKSLEVENLPAGATVTYEGNSVTEVGVYTITAKIQKANYKDLTLNAKLTITTGNVTFDLEDKIVTYNGQAQTITATNSSLTLSYEYYLGETKLDSAPVDAGEYIVKAIYAGDKNHEKLEKTATLTIQKATMDMSSISFSNASYTYDGSEKELVITGTLPSGVSVSYENNKLTNAGSVVAKAKFVVEDVKNYNLIEDMEATLTIEKASYDMSSVSFSDTTYTYDGSEKELVITGNLPTGVTVRYENNKLTNAGSVVAKAIFTIADPMNYNEVEDKVATLKVEKATVSILAEDILVEMGQAYEISYTCTISGLEIDITYFDFEDKEIAKPTSSGVYKAVLKFAGNENYASCSKTVHITITDPSLGNVTIELDTIHTVYKEVYEVNPIVTPAVDVTIKYFSQDVECEKPTNAGAYKIEISFAGSSTLNPKVVYVDLIIEKATLDMSGVSFLDASYTYDGSEKNLIISGDLPEGVSVSYETNTLTNVGSIVAKAIFTIADSKNYNAIEPMLATLTILPADSDLATLTKTTFELDYVSGMTIENFKEMLDEYHLSVFNYSQPLTFGNNEISASYTQDENHKPTDVTILLVCKKAKTGFTILEDHRQIKGRDFDINNLLVYTTYNDGSREVMENQPSLTVNTSSIDTNRPFTVEVTITSGEYDGQTANVEVAPIDKPKVMIYAAYTAGGNANATYKYDFIILYNGSNQNISLAGWTVQYINSKKSITTISLQGEIKAYSYYKIRCASSTVGSVLPFQEDLANNTNMAVGDCSIYLATTKTAITENYEQLSYVDLLGIGSAPYKEGAAVAKPSNNTSYIKRNDPLDSNQNSLDFEMVSFNGTTDFEFLNPGHEVYNYAKAYIEELGLDFENLPESFSLPTSYNGISIVWSSDIANLSISDSGIVTVTKVPTAVGTLKGTIEGYHQVLSYEVKVSDKVILKTPNIVLTHLTLTWDAIANATHYEIYVNNVKYAEEANCSYDLLTNPDFASIFSSAKAYVITVKACSTDGAAYENSEMSNEQSINVADTTNLTPNTVYLFKVVVTAKSTGLQSNFFVVDPMSKVGLLAFNYSTDAQTQDVIYITGKYELFSKLPEITNISGITKLETLDNSAFAEYIETEEPTFDHIGHLINGAEAEVISLPEMSGNYGSVVVKLNNIIYTLYANKNYVSNIEAFKSLLPGYKLSFNGAVGRYNDTLQIYLTSYEVTDETVSTEYKLDVTLEEVSLKANYTADEIVSLPIQGSKFNDVTISYTSTAGGNVQTTDSLATLTFESSATSVTLIITASILGIQKTKNVILNISPAGSAQEGSIVLSSKNTGASVNLGTSPSDSNSDIIGDTEHIFNISSQKNNASNTAGVNKDGTIKLYGKADTNGTSITISGKTGVTITKVVVTLKSASGTGNFSVNGLEAEQVGTTEQSFSYDITNNEFAIQNKNDSTTQVHILSISITYTQIN